MNAAAHAPFRPRPAATLDVASAIRDRRAIRKYTNEIVDRSLIEELLRAAVCAPSALDLQPWAFAVFQGAELLASFSRRAVAHMRDAGSTLVPEARRAHGGPEESLFHGASTLVVICATSDDRQAAEDCCLAAQNVMLTAHAMGLGTCPIGSARAWLSLPETRAELGLGHAVPVFPIAIGIPAETPRAPERKAPVILAWHENETPEHKHRRALEALEAAPHHETTRRARKLVETPSRAAKPTARSQQRRFD